MTAIFDTLQTIPLSGAIAMIFAALILIFWDAIFATTKPEDMSAADRYFWKVGDCGENGDDN